MIYFIIMQTNFRSFYTITRDNVYLHW